jgi:hypothetical protein
VKRLAFIFFVAAVIAHALMSAVAGSVVPSDWSALELGVCMFILAPCAGLLVAVVSGAFDRPLWSAPPNQPRRTAAERRALHHRDT